MNRIFVLLIISAFSLNAATWSSETQSGIHNAYNTLDQLVDRKNEQSKQKWEDIKELIKKIGEQEERKNKLLQEINALQKEQSKNEEEIMFLMEQEKQLLNNYGSISGAAKEQ